MILIASVSILEVLNRNLYNGWDDIIIQMIRPVISLGLLFLVYKKISIAKWLFLLWCVPILLVNSSTLLDIKSELSKRHFGNVITVISLYTGYLIALYFTLFKSNITSKNNKEENLTKTFS